MFGMVVPDDDDDDDESPLRMAPADFGRELLELEWPG